MLIQTQAAPLSYALQSVMFLMQIEGIPCFESYQIDAILIQLIESTFFPELYTKDISTFSRAESLAIYSLELLYIIVLFQLFHWSKNLAPF